MFFSQGGVFKRERDFFQPEWDFVGFTRGGGLGFGDRLDNNSCLKYPCCILHIFFAPIYKCRVGCKCKVIEKLTNGHPLSSSNLTIWLQLDLLKELELRYVFQCNEETKLFISNPNNVFILENAMTLKQSGIS